MNEPPRGIIRSLAAIAGYRLMIWRMPAIGRSRLWRLGDRLVTWGRRQERYR